MNQKEMDPQSLFKMMLGFQTTQVLYSASTLGIFEELHAAQRALPARAVANKLCTNQDATARLMNACAGLGILRKHTDTSGQETFENSQVTKHFLVKSSPMSMAFVLSNIGGDLYPLWGKLRDGVQHGLPQLTQTFGGTGENIFEPGNGFFSSHSKQLEFLEVMNVFSSCDAPAILAQFDLSEFGSICDLGGGTGALASAVAHMYPQSTVTLLDLDHVVACAPHFLSDKKPRNLILQSGDFFKDDLPEADLYILCHVVHDWSDEAVHELLGKIYTSLKPGGALLLLEKFLYESKDGPVDALMFDLGMLVAAEGRERTASEYLDLLEGHGFTDCDSKVIPNAKWHDGVLARKY